MKPSYVHISAGVTFLKYVSHEDAETLCDPRYSPAYLCVSAIRWLTKEFFFYETKGSLLTYSLDI
jgi:hypothetical protein